MSHLVDRCDVIDMLEESARLHRKLLVKLKGGRRFVDQARDVVTDGQGEWAVFRSHDRVLIDDITFCSPESPLEPSYRGKH